MGYSGARVGPTEETVSASEDAELLKRIAARDRAAFEVLYERHAPRVFRFVFRMVRDEGRAEEVTNDAMVEVWKTAGRFAGRSAPSTWILGIARFRALNSLRGKSLPTRELSAAREVKSMDPRPDEVRETRARNQRLRDAMEKLSPKHREVLELTFFEGCSYREISKIVECPENTVKTRMLHAKKQLRPLLIDAQVSEATA